MKRILFSMMALLAMAGTSVAQTNALTVADITVPQNSEAELTVSFQLDAADTYTGYSFQLELPSELEFVMDEGTDVACTKGSCHDASHSVTANLSEGLVKVAGLSLSSKPLVGTSGELLTFTIKPATTLTVGQTFTGTIKNILIVPVEGTKQSLADATFTVTVGEPADLRTILNETSTEAPAAAMGVNVRVKRTISANQWNTICLPFAMTAEQCQAAFGNDVQLGDFNGYETTEEGGSVIGINAKFNTATAIEANHPYIIKVSQAVSEFTLDGVDIDPQEAKVEFDNGKTGKQRKVLGTFAGTYTADFDFYNEATSYPLFLSGGKFYYATDKTMHMKAFRAYFDFVDYLEEAETAAAPIFISFNGETTGIGDVKRESITDDRYYNLSGQRVENPTKGLYIKNGKKVVVK